jgi:ABC-type transporter Mla subunit MlaD
MSALSDLLRDRIDIKPARHRPRPLGIGLVVIVVIVVALVSAVTHHVPLIPTSGQTVHAVFNSADQVSGRTVVRVDGVQVGNVVGVSPGPDPYRNSLVTMQITDPGIHLHSDASAQIRWRTVFGGLVYIDLHPGSSAAPALVAPIPVARTSNQVELDELLDTYSGVTPQEQRNMIGGLASSFSAPGGIDRTLHTLGPALTTAGAGLAPLLGTQDGDLSGLVAAAARTVAGLDNTPGLQNLVSGADETLAATDATHVGLGQSLDLLPSSLQSTDATMARLRITLIHLNPLVTRLQPGARAVAPAIHVADPTLGELDAVLHDARPLLSDASPTFAALHQASEEGVPLMEGLDPTLTRLVSKLLPFLNSTDSGTKLKIYESIGPFFSSIDSAASQYDAIGHRIRLSVVPSLAGFLTTAPTGAMTAACDASTVPHAQTLCPSLVGALARGWFDPGKRGGS